MEQQEFYKQLIEQLTILQIKLTKTQQEQFYQYMNLLIQWNEMINLTSIVEPKEILQKHFVDSLTIQKYIREEDKILDIGTGAGFPGIPLKIVNPTNTVVLLDSLNKRLDFLREVKEKLQLQKLDIIHARAEEQGKNIEYREKFDVVTSRAVASLNVLVEYLLPFVKKGGTCIAMKGSNCKEEIQNSQKAVKILGGRIEKIEELTLPNTDIKRTIIIIRKEEQTPIKYPRKAGTPTKEPIL